MGALEVIVPSPRIGQSSAMLGLWSWSTPIALGMLVALVGGCEEGFEDTTWSTEDGLRTLTLFEGGAAWEERYVDRESGDPVIVDGLRFEGTFTSADDALDADVRCVRAENAQLATPCDATIARKLSCTLVEESDAKLTCKVGDAEVALVRDDARRVTH